MAQLAEQLICNQQVIGSSPIIGFGRELSENETQSKFELSRSHAVALNETKVEFSKRLASERCLLLFMDL